MAVWALQAAGHPYLYFNNNYHIRPSFYIARLGIQELEEGLLTVVIPYLRLWEAKTPILNSTLQVSI